MRKKWFNEKTVILTGASSGLGKLIATRLIKENNCNVVGIGRNVQKLDAVKAELGENFTPYQMDVSIKENWKTLADYLAQNGIQPDIMINNAGIMPKFKRVDKLSSDDVAAVMDTNFMSAVYSVEYILPMIKRSETPAIINVSSAAALLTVCGMGSYCASKSALKSYTEALWVENRKNMYVGLIMPGFIRTDIMRSQNLNDKERKIVNFFSMDINKAVNKIMKTISKKKPRKIMGFDARSMNFFYKRFPKATMKMLMSLFRKVKFTLFEDVFAE